MAARPDFVSGNTRLRARLPLLAAAADEPDATVRAERVRSLLRAVPPAYSEPVRSVVAIMTARHDLADVVALVRGALRGRPPQERLWAVEGVGAVTPEAAGDVAQAPDGRAAINRLRALSLPDRALAARVPEIWAAYELHDDIEELETDLACAAYVEWAERLRRAGPPAAAIAELLAAERDLANLRTVLRVPAAVPIRLLPPGRLDRTTLTAVARGDWRGVRRARPEWRLPDPSEPTTPWADVALELAVRAGWRDRTAPWLRRGDVFSAQVAVGFVLTVEAATHPSALVAPAGEQRSAA